MGAPFSGAHDVMPHQRCASMTMARKSPKPLRHTLSATGVRRRTTTTSAEMADDAMVEDVRHWEWPHMAFWSLDTEEEARGSGFYPVEVIMAVPLLNCRLPEQGCRRPRCRQCAIVKRKKWAPRLPGMEVGNTAGAVFGLPHCRADMGPLSGVWPRPVEYGAAVNLVLGKATFKELTHWGLAAVYERHFNHDVTQCAMDVQPTKIQIGAEVVLRFRMPWDAGNGSNNSFLNDEERE